MANYPVKPSTTLGLMRLSLLPMTSVPITLRENICRRQLDILERVFSRHTEAQVFLCGFDYASEHEDTAVVGHFTILGALRDEKRNTYSVTLYNDGPSFACSCPDHRRRYMSEGTYCKHISFIICKVAGVTSSEIFSTKRLDACHYDRLITSITTLFVDVPNFKPTGIVSDKLVFDGPGRPLDEDSSCPVCLSDMAAGDKLLTCPKCQNSLHAECMRAWLYRKASCPFCRDTCWTRYK